jgi:phosphatidylserine decarboxylase
MSHHILVAAVFWIATGALAWYFRDPRRHVPASPLAVVAPVDGVVSAIQESADAYVGRQAMSITLRKPWYSVITLRSPMEGKVQKQWFGGSGVHLGINDGNRFAQWIQSDEGDDVCVALQPLSKSRFFRCYLHAGERIGQGQRCGIYPLAALVEVKLPMNSLLHVKVGDRIKGGADKLATLVH